MHAARYTHILGHERRSEEMKEEAEDMRKWIIREGAGLVLPLNGRLIEFSRLGTQRLDELDTEICAAHLRVALKNLERSLAQNRGA